MGSHKYVLLRTKEGYNADETHKAEDVTGTMDDLTAGLRPWLLAFLRDGSHPDGWYLSCLVATDEAGAYDTYHSLASEHVIWYWDEEYVPVSSMERGSTERRAAVL
jgi:hypothetical protein